tara:strand:+ start:2865 stop:3701 length:837 start_codon:yes stop_codon:yes gene_type:complete
MESTPPKIFPVKDPEEEYLNKSGLPPVHPHLPQIDGYGGGACLLMISPVKTGKSTIVSNLLLSSDFYDAQERFDSTHIISNTIANDVTSRYLKEAFDTYDQYNDSIIDGLVERQKEFKKEDQPEIAVVVDDCLGSIKREGRINHLASRFRHFNIKLLIISSQNFRSVSPIIRQNATNVIVGSPFPNRKELLKIGEEFGDLFGGPEKWIALYKKATPERYNFIHMDLQSNPPKMYKNFDELIAEGERDMMAITQKDIVEEETNTKKSKKDNVEENVESK